MHSKLSTFVIIEPSDWNARSIEAMLREAYPCKIIRFKSLKQLEEKMNCINSDYFFINGCMVEDMTANGWRTPLDFWESIKSYPYLDTPYNKREITLKIILYFPEDAPGLIYQAISLKAPAVLAKNPSQGMLREAVDYLKDMPKHLDGNFTPYIDGRIYKDTRINVLKKLHITNKEFNFIMLVLQNLSYKEIAERLYNDEASIKSLASKLAKRIKSQYLPQSRYNDLRPKDVFQLFGTTYDFVKVDIIDATNVTDNTSFVICA